MGMIWMQFGETVQHCKLDLLRFFIQKILCRCSPDIQVQEYHEQAGEIRFRLKLQRTKGGE
jgi:hypothetical protein